MSDRDVGKTLDDLEPPAWGDAPPDATGLVTRCHALRRKPLTHFDAGDLRVMIGQQISLRFLVPRDLNLIADEVMQACEYIREPLRMFKVETFT